TGDDDEDVGDEVGDRQRREEACRHDPGEDSGHPGDHSHLKLLLAIAAAATPHAARTAKALRSPLPSTRAARMVSPSPAEGNSARAPPAEPYVSRGRTMPPPISNSR